MESHAACSELVLIISVYSVLLLDEESLVDEPRPLDDSLRAGECQLVELPPKSGLSLGTRVLQERDSSPPLPLRVLPNTGVPTLPITFPTFPHSISTARHILREWRIGHPTDCQISGFCGPSTLIILFFTSSPCYRSRYRNLNSHFFGKSPCIKLRLVVRKFHIFATDFRNEKSNLAPPNRLRWLISRRARKQYLWFILKNNFCYYYWVKFLFAQNIIPIFFIGDYI